eukprot:TRINITY_DN24978_c0_g1_i2.p1 TRINITY_DN24978_c0_g1~~TRINITY_DN24978_c0_g1_i2.p1  ORF type:complete len:347 (-),score=55.70 TRINITY_DN24978_c0_g1_i2:61-1071(-)
MTGPAPRTTRRLRKRQHALIEESVVKASCNDLSGYQAHFVQIGLGTNTTFVQNLAGPARDWMPCIDWLLSACSESRPDSVRGVAVEPVKEYAEAIRRLAAKHLHHVVVLEAAIGEEDKCSVDLHVLESPQKLIAKAPKNQRRDLKWHLTFLENMSCVGSAHPEFSEIEAWIDDQYGLQAKMAPQSVKQLSWTSLVHTLKFCGCQVLLVDAEGHDASILRSMLEHCRGRPHELPELIQFETRGHCDSCEGGNSEWEIIESLEAAGYVLVAYSYNDTHLVYGPALQREPRLRAWSESWVCDTCGGQGCMPYAWGRDGTWCKRCCDQWWSTSSFEPESQ